ncbi:uncharacterized protein K452DRAFT_222508 [Aplosporella prunicola CBS 121167]|uniref:Carboxylic ester hydrolase n=1 Tax=Aplosporella prunicola CBS 121167 TaxID=1176127 RepID=A0A6A6BKT8_9PEZI|nr:uncharacterized protein K452DRAFT_222508 [Aplosporella prunicola CBS 121167]KAF2144742.1 hypothetical protein K452DRAFT_222508 [Aplosporella prunicola CBS 121167]
MWFATGALLLWAAQDVLSAPSASHVKKAAPSATVKNGTYTGVHSTSYKQDFFLGMPFAQPPVGDLRFRNPQSLNTTWDGAKSATAYSDTCVGYGSDQFGYEVTEDCLYLNVVRPSGYDNQKLPVAFWIHGGGFFEGSAGDKRYNLSFIVQNGVDLGKPFIAVSTNYRLSAWGFLQGEDVQKSGQTNVGIRDQRLALHWVQENIGAFGGDPSKVTIWGESAGAASVGAHLVAYNGRDDKLFRGAVMQSGAPIYFAALNSSTDQQPKYEQLLTAVGCSNATDSLDCLRAVPYEDLNKAINTTALTQWGLSFDHDLFQELGSVQVAKGDVVRVPIIMGANSDEGTAFGTYGIDNTTQFENSLLASGVPANFTPSILEAYPDIPALGIPGSGALGPLPADFRPSLPYGAQFRRSAAYGGDYTFIASRRRTCELWATHGLAAYCYRFNAIPAGLAQIPGVTHFQEVAFVFDNVDGLGYAPVATPPFQGKGKGYTDLAKLMSNSWVSFIVDGDPNGYNRQGRQNTGKWPKYDNSNPLDFVFDANVTSHTEPDTYRKEGMKLIADHAADVYGR